MLGLKLIHVIKRGPRGLFTNIDGLKFQYGWIITPCKVWDGLTYPFENGLSHFIPHTLLDMWSLFYAGIQAPQALKAWVHKRCCFKQECFFISSNWSMCMGIFLHWMVLKTYMHICIYNDYICVYIIVLYCIPSYIIYNCENSPLTVSSETEWKKICDKHFDWGLRVGVDYNTIDTMIHNMLLLLLRASYQIRRIAGCACAGNVGNVFPRRRLQKKPLVSDPGMHHGTCVTHVPGCMSGSLTRGGGENVPRIPGACAPAILRIWQETHRVWGIHTARYFHRYATLNETIYCYHPNDKETITIFSYLIWQLCCRCMS